MDQLLAVSLREEELNNFLEDLGRSLLQAQNALQAAYAEVQRLLRLRQQVKKILEIPCAFPHVLMLNSSLWLQYAADINSLRAKRIEILQGLQGPLKKKKKVFFALNAKAHIYNEVFVI